MPSKQQTPHYLTVIALSFCLAAASAAAAEPDAATQGHSHHGASARLALDHGRKWVIDEPLRKAMTNIRNAMAASLGGIHEGKFSPAEYDELARKVNGEVEYMVSNCKLKPEADAQLHLVIAGILEGVEAMQGKLKNVQRLDGAVKVIGALEQYAVYFDDAGWKPLNH